jgi:hypothetical protein
MRPFGVEDSTCAFPTARTVVQRIRSTSSINTPKAVRIADVPTTAWMVRMIFPTARYSVFSRNSVTVRYVSKAVHIAASTNKAASIHNAGAALLTVFFISSPLAV